VDLSFLKKPSRYVNHEINAVFKDASVKVVLAFPDIYEIGMSHLGLKILYKIINDLPFASAERAFSPWTDLEAEIKKNSLFLTSLESGRPLRDFDIVGFSLQYELSYTTVLNMLHLGGIPVKTGDRITGSGRDGYPLVIAGGPCTVNPAPMSPYIDAFLIGDGEDAIVDILDIFYSCKTQGDGGKESLLKAFAEIQGIYVPSIHRSNGSVVKRRIVPSLDNAPFPDSPVVPYTSIVHDRINVEVLRGCTMGCRFCQAGMIYRPVRERNPEKTLELAEAALKNTGYAEVAFTSLSTGDYSCLLQIIQEFNRRFSKDRIAISLPSLRVASINRDILREMRTVRKTGFTIAPEAGTERLRKVINKNFSEEDYEASLCALFEEGWNNLKLYFMIGLPTESEEDMKAIAEMALKALKIAKRYSKRFININVGVSPFVPKAHTPFQWCGQESYAKLRGKKSYLKEILTRKGLHVKGHDVDMSLLEAAFARGDEQTAPLIEKAWALGCRLDGWSEVFDFEKWKRAMDETGTDAMEVARKTFILPDALPWDNIDIGITKNFLWREYQAALSGEITADCRKVCHDCGLECNKNFNGQHSSAVSPGIDVGQQSIRGNLPGMRFKPVRIRVEYSKTGRLRYLSHLELIMLVQRSIRRAEFPLEYSRGFNPSPRISFGPPLSVGTAGLREYFDMEVVPPFDLTDNRLRINRLLPDGFCVTDMVAVPLKSESLDSFISRYEYEVKGADISNMQVFLSKKEIPVKREKTVINIRNMVQEATIIDEDKVKLVLMDNGEIKVRLGEILPLVCNVPLEKLEITRTAVYGWDGGWVNPIERSVQWIAKY
jgi:radical SAM family uncharacterized protein/radical SAM-linked protein